MHHEYSFKYRNTAKMFDYLDRKFLTLKNTSIGRPMRTIHRTARPDLVPARYARASLKVLDDHFVCYFICLLAYLILMSRT